MSSVKDPLVWIDCEMTGLSLDHDMLVEVAVIPTDAQLKPLDAGIDLIINPGQAALSQMGDFVRNMHTKSGLLDAIDAEGIALADAEARVLDYIKTFVPEPRKALLAGNSVGTDKAFLAKDMPSVIDYLHYRIVDVSTVKELAKRWFPRSFYQSPEKHGGHRALADIRESIIELRYYREALFPSDEGPSTPECQAIARKVLSEGLDA